jgi:hypothetical protein
MALKDQSSQANSVTKEKILTIQFLEKEKDNLRLQIDKLTQEVKKLEQQVNEEINLRRLIESKVALSDQQHTYVIEQMTVEKESNSKALED